MIEALERTDRYLMDESQRPLLDAIRANPSDPHGLAGIAAGSVKHYILSEWQIATANDNWQARSSLNGIIYSIQDEQLKADILNALLITPGHHQHQEIMRDIQDLGHPSSIASIRKMLESQYKNLQYCSSEDQNITKWFSHALADIGTPESIAMIRTFALSPNPGMARGMRYRLRQMRRQGRLP